jgi:3'-phosphoadenosine 5'-phosphosulfate sulfotransferase (PAPS reductase)/FAD synthetase
MTTTPDMASYDIIFINTSGGKDSQTALGVTMDAARAAGVADRCVAVHADLGRVEWQGTQEIARKQVEAYGIPFHVVKRNGNDLLDQIRYERKKFPGGNMGRFCTSDQKTGACKVLCTKLVKEWHAANPNAGRRCRVLNVLGMRAEESNSRAKEEPFVAEQKGWTNKTVRHVDRWLPIHAWTEIEVWDDIKARGIAYHTAYDLGMPRLSCAFCVYAKRSDLLIAGEHNPALLDAYVEVEQEINFPFAKKWTIESIRDALRNGERGTKHTASPAFDRQAA